MLTSQHLPTINETLYHQTLENGLNVFLLPKQGYTKIFATFASKFGSKDLQFTTNDSRLHIVPDGIAHFLEHKMFADPNGDVFAKFATQGASVNAFTSFDLTNYLFSSSENALKNIETLLSFVQTPYFTDENIEKEKGIIAQEIRMYDDNPDWRLYFGVISSLITFKKLLYKKYLFQYFNYISFIC
jgi:predicted Zn-dependent peptidase